MANILYIEDKLGITENYKGIFANLATTTGLAKHNVIRFSLYKAYPNTQWLNSYANRKAPTWNPAHSDDINEILIDAVVRSKAVSILNTDPASLSILGIPADIATLDNLRGGVYRPWIPKSNIPMIITLPINVWHKQVKEKDLMTANKGFTDKEEFDDFYNTVDHDDDADSDSDEDEDDEESSDGHDSSQVADQPTFDEDANLLFYSPQTVPYGKFVLNADYRKARRVTDGELK